MKKFFFFFILIQVSVNLFSQKEIFFSVKAPDSIKVESLHGIETRLSLFPSEFSSYSLPSNYTPSIYVGYFKEKRIADCWTLNTTIGLQNVLARQLIYQIDTTSGYYSSGNNYKNVYSLRIEAGIEPRWYINYKSRYTLGLANLNSGWYLSFPLSFQTTLLQTPDQLFNPNWLPSNFAGSLIFTPTLGFRQAISNRFFFESSLGLGVIEMFGIYSSKFNIYTPFFYPKFCVRLGYTFK
jgi:hypothetical protein